MKTVKDFLIPDKRVLLRCDFNVPLDESGTILDDFKIKAALPTLRYLLENKAKVIVISHLGNPEGKMEPLLTLHKVRERLEQLLHVQVIKTSDCVGPEVKEAVFNLESGQVLLLENVRFHQEEMDNDAEFAKEISKAGEYYINEAFSECHRAYASIASVPTFLEHGAGLLLESEVKNLDKVLKNPKRPMAALIGGKKVETKISFINTISRVADWVIINGLLKKELLEKNIALENPNKILFPEGDLAALDINESTMELFKEKILTAGTILWNGPFGKFEDEQFSKGTLAIANAIIESGAFSVVGGGETIEFLDKNKLTSKFSHISTGGGAMLSYLAGEELPGLKALE